MKRIFFLSVAVLIMSVICVPADADNVVVRKNIQINLKAYADGVIYDKGDAAINPGFLVTFTSRDIIQGIGARDGVSFGKSASLVMQEIYNDQDGSLLESAFLIVEKGKTDYDISNSVAVNQHATFGKYRYSISKGTGTYTDYVLTQIVITSGDLQMFLLGMMVESGKRTLPYPSVPVSNSSAKMAGEIYEGEDVIAVVEGTVKTTGANILK